MEMVLTKSTLCQRLQKFSNTKYAWSGLEGKTFSKLPKASVLVPLYIKNGEVFIWLIKRSEKVRGDPGEVAFPGGLKEHQDDNEMDTCLRESFEEIGLVSTKVEISGQFLPWLNPRHILLTPVVGVVDSDFIPVVNKNEVDMVFSIPLRRFLSCQGHYGSPTLYKNTSVYGNFFHETVNGESLSIFGITANICIQLAVCVYERLPPFKWYTGAEPTVDNPFLPQEELIRMLEVWMEKELATFTRMTIKERLDCHNATKYHWPNLEGTVFSSYKKAAVLIPLFIKDREVYVWLTKRSRHLRTDAGHVAFPGGMKDSHETSAIETCLREADEEIGLKSHQVDIVCQLMPRMNSRRVLITPVIGIVDADFQPQINESEVEKIFFLPFRRFLSSAGHRSDIFHNREIDWYIHYFEDHINGEVETTWGLTAGLLVETAICLYEMEPEFEWLVGPKPKNCNPFFLQIEYLERLKVSLEEEQSVVKQSKL